MADKAATLQSGVRLPNVCPWNLTEAKSERHGTQGDHCCCNAQADAFDLRGA